MTNDELSEKIGAVREDIARLTVLVETEGKSCPYRETIAKSANNSERLRRLEQTSLGGGIVGVAGAVLFAIGKTQGWW